MEEEGKCDSEEREVKVENSGERGVNLGEGVSKLSSNQQLFLTPNTLPTPSLVLFLLPPPFLILP